MVRLRADGAVIHPGCEITDCEFGGGVPRWGGAAVSRMWRWGIIPIATGPVIWPMPRARPIIRRIGHNAQVKPGVVVDHGAVAAAGAVVTRDIAPYVVVAGVPTRPLRARRVPHLAERMIALAWWDRDHARLRAALAEFCKLGPEAFLDRYEQQ